MLFGWIRHQVRAAVLSGIADAVAEIDTGTDSGTADAVAALRQRLQALPAPAPDVPEPEAGNGRRGRKTA
jgi:hypothetical protein